VTELLPYRWSRPAETGPLAELINEPASGSLDAVTFTSAAAVRSMLTLAAEPCKQEAPHAALGTTVLAACAGPVPAAPLPGTRNPGRLPQRTRTAPLDHAVEQQPAP
jgi:uroporphyrinogen-III synthase